MANDLLKELSQYPNKWVALNETRTKILAIGNSIKELEKLVTKKFSSEEVIVTKILPKDQLYAPFSA